MTTLAINKSATPSNAVAQVAGSLVYGGTLVITNLGPNAFSPGDSFKLFTASNYSGGFTSLAPVIPGINLGMEHQQPDQRHFGRGFIAHAAAAHQRPQVERRQSDHQRHERGAGLALLRIEFHQPRPAAQPMAAPGHECFRQFGQFSFYESVEFKHLAGILSPPDAVNQRLWCRPKRIYRRTDSRRRPQHLRQSRIEPDSVQILKSET